MANFSIELRKTFFFNQFFKVTKITNKSFNLGTKTSHANEGCRKQKTTKLKKTLIAEQARCQNKYIYKANFAQKKKYSITRLS